MSRRIGLPLAFALLLLIGCSTTPKAMQPEMIDTILEAPIDRVKIAITQVLTEDGYDVEWESDQTLKTGYRDKYPGPWNWLLHLRFGTMKSRVEATVTPSAEQTTRLRLQVMSEGKDGIFTSWEEVPSAVPQTAENQLRLIKNALQIL
jgi:hypothetical protein